MHPLHCTTKPSIVTKWHSRLAVRHCRVSHLIPTKWFTMDWVCFVVFWWRPQCVVETSVMIHCESFGWNWVNHLYKTSKICVLYVHILSHWMDIITLLLYKIFYFTHAVVEAWSVSSVSVQNLTVDEKETNNASVFISEDLLSQQENGARMPGICQLYTYLIISV